MGASPVRAGTRWAACRRRLMPTIRRDATRRFRLPGVARCGDLSGAVTRSIELDDATTRRLERHETMAHAIPSRRRCAIWAMRSSCTTRGPRSVLEPDGQPAVAAEPAAFDHRLNEAVAMFALDGRQPHIWPSPAHNAPAGPRRAAPGGRVPRRRRRPRDGAGRSGGVPAAPARRARSGASRWAASAGPRTRASATSTTSRGCSPSRSARCRIERGSWRTTCAGRWTTRGSRSRSVRVDGEPAAVAKATTFDGFTYLSSIGTRAAFRGRGLPRWRPAHAVAIAGGGSAPSCTSACSRETSPRSGCTSGWGSRRAASRRTCCLAEAPARGCGPG